MAKITEASIMNMDVYVQALIDAVNAFNGGIIMISHDVRLVLI